VPVFAPPNELGFQASIEAFNGRWQQKLWARFWDPDLTALQERSAGYVGASRRRAVARIEPAPPRSSCAHRGSRRRRELGKAECPPNGIRAAGPPAHLVTNGPALSRSTM